MHIFTLHTLSYLALHGAGFLLTMFSIMGIPGNVDEKKSATKLLLKLINILILSGWYGIRGLVLVSITAFYFEYDKLGKASSIVSLCIGGGLFISMIILYWLNNSDYRNGMDNHP